MARFRKVTPIRDNLPGILAGMAASALVLFLMWASPRFVPAAREFLFGPDNAPSIESAAPEEEPQPDGNADAEGPSGEERGAQSLKTRLWTACKKFWPALLAFITVMEAAEYAGKLFILVKKLFR